VDAAGAHCVPFQVSTCPLVGVVDATALPLSLSTLVEWSPPDTSPVMIGELSGINYQVMVIEAFPAPSEITMETCPPA
jgi:hypothetical protein